MRSDRGDISHRISHSSASPEELLFTKRTLSSPASLLASRIKSVPDRKSVHSREFCDRCPTMMISLRERGAPLDAQAAYSIVGFVYKKSADDSWQVLWQLPESLSRVTTKKSGFNRPALSRLRVYRTPLNSCSLTTEAQTEHFGC